MTGLDTNVLVRYLTRDDEAQFRAARRLLKRLERSGESAYIGVVVLCELSWVLTFSYGFDRATLASTLGQILQTVEFTLEDRDLVREAVEEFASGRGGFADYLIGFRNRKAGCHRTATFDRALGESDRFLVL